MMPIYKRGAAQRDYKKYSNQSWREMLARLAAERKGELPLERRDASLERRGALQRRAAQSTQSGQGSWES